MIEKLTYTGIGSRNLSKDQYKFCKNIAKEMAIHGWILRSGGAPGADSAFEEGCNEVDGEKEIFLPWHGFNNNRSKYFSPTLEAYDMARKFHPNYSSLSSGTIKLMARNSHQIFGKNMNESVNIVLYSALETQCGIVLGGTGQAVRIAKYYKIPVINLYYIYELDPKFIVDQVKHAVYIN